MSIGPLTLLAALALTAPPPGGVRGGPQIPQESLASTRARLARIAARAGQMRSYSFELRAEVKGLENRPAPVRVQVAAGQPVHFVEGRIEAFIQGRRIVLREGDGDWDVIDFRLNPMLERMARSWQGAMTGPDGSSKDQDAKGERDGKSDGVLPKGRPLPERPPLAHPPSPEARLQAVKMLHIPLPHVVLSQVGESLEKVEVTERDGQIVVTADLNEEARRKLRPLLPGGGRARPRSPQKPGWETKARIRITALADGQVIQYEMAVRHTGTFRGRAFDQKLAHTVRLSRIGSTEIEVPAEVLALL